MSFGGLKGAEWRDCEETKCTSLEKIFSSKKKISAIIFSSKINSATFFNTWKIYLNSKKNIFDGFYQLKLGSL